MDRNKTLKTVETVYKGSFQSQQHQDVSEKLTNTKEVISQGSQELSDISIDEIKSVIYEMKNNISLRKDFF